MAVAYCVMFKNPVLYFCYLPWDSGFSTLRQIKVVFRPCICIIPVKAIWSLVCWSALGARLALRARCLVRKQQTSVWQRLSKRGHQPFSRGHHLVGTLFLCDMCRPLRTWLCTRCNAPRNCRCCYFQTPSVIHCMNTTAQSPKLLRNFYPQKFLPTSAGNAQAPLHFCGQCASSVALSGWSTESVWN